MQQLQGLCCRLHTLNGLDEGELWRTVGLLHELFMPMHFEALNVLTFSAFDPYSRQPAYQACAVKIARCKPESSG